MKAFQISREDGRSNAQVVIDLVKDDKPGTIYSYRDIANALEAGTEQKYDRAAVQQVVANLHSRLLKEQERAFVTLRNRGYRLAAANEHTALARSRHRKADVQFYKGVQVLRNVRWNEMTDNERQAHQGQLMIAEAIYANQQALTRRVDSIEAAIRGLTAKK